MRIIKISDFVKATTDGGKELLLSPAEVGVGMVRLEVAKSDELNDKADEVMQDEIIDA